MTSQFTKLEKHLRSQAGNQMLSSIFFEGIAPDKAAAIEAKLGWSVSEEVKNFFFAHNGLVLKWMDRADKRFDPDLHTEVNDWKEIRPAVMEVEDYNPRAGTGQLLIASFETLFAPDLMELEAEEDLLEFRFAHEESFWEEDDEEPWDQPMTFRGVDYPSKHDFVQRLRFLDIFSRDRVAMMLLEPENPDPPVFQMLTRSTSPEEY